MYNEYDRTPFTMDKIASRSTIRVSECHPRPCFFFTVLSPLPSFRSIH